VSAIAVKKIFFKRKPAAEVQNFESLVSPHTEHLYRVAFRFCGNQHDAEDLVQDLYTKLYSKNTALEHIEQLRPWLAKSLYRAYIDQYRRSKRSPISLEEDEQYSLESAAPAHDEPEARLSQLEQQRELQTALSTLSEEHRSLLILADIEGYSLPELQQVFDIPEGTVKSRLHRARAKLREILLTK
jgi:RNA polymerase sigma factor (sigma-70 family)